MQWVMSIGIPATHHPKAVLNPPANRYTSEHRPPKAKPNIQEKAAQNSAPSLLRNTIAKTVRIGQT